MAENRTPEKTTVPNPPGNTRPRALGMYDRPDKPKGLSPMLMIGIVVLLVLIVLAFYFLF